MKRITVTRSNDDKHLILSVQTALRETEIELTEGQAERLVYALYACSGRVKRACMSCTEARGTQGIHLQQELYLVEGLDIR